MSEPTDDLSRYTWIEDSPTTIHVLRRTGLYSQEKVEVLINPGVPPELRNEQREILNALCEYLDRRDRELSGRKR